MGFLDKFRKKGKKKPVKEAAEELMKKIDKATEEPIEKIEKSDEMKNFPLAIKSLKTVVNRLETENRPIIFLNPSLMFNDWSAFRKVQSVPFSDFPVFIAAHEARHIYQNKTKLLTISPNLSDDRLYWKGKSVITKGVVDTEYFNLPHEKDANTAATNVLSTISNNKNMEGSIDHVDS